MPDWRSYDSAANAHERLRVPLIFAAPARDLVARMEQTMQLAWPPDRKSLNRKDPRFRDNAGCMTGPWLDVGTGSGVVARAVAGPGAVVGVDPSFEMARIARESGVARVAVASTPGLPFAAECFDRVSAGFVLSHIAQLEDALRDMVRVLRTGGVLGATAWRDRASEHLDLWEATLERFIEPEELASARRQATPWEELLSRDGALAGALAEAGLGDVTAELREYPVPMTIATFLEMRETSSSARYARPRIGPAGWSQFRDAVSREFAARFRDPIDQTWSAWITVGRK